MKSIYNKIKFIVYLFGLFLTIYSILKYGLVESHTPPLGFVIPIFFILLSLVWIIFDWLLVYILKSNKIDYRYHYFGLVTNLIIIILILYL